MLKNQQAGQEAVASTSGPMSPSFSSLTLVAQSIISSSPWLIDPKCLPIPWRQESLEAVKDKKLKIGVVRHDGSVMPTPPVKRALDITVQKLREKGHEVVEWDCEGYKQASSLLASLVFSLFSHIAIPLISTSLIHNRVGCFLRMVRIRFSFSSHH